MAGTGVAGVCADCLKWSKQYSKVEGGRNALRETVKILENRLDKLIQDNSTLNKELEEARGQEKQSRAKDSDARAALEKEIAALKSELQESRRSDASDTACQVSRLQLCVSDYEKEVMRLKELVEKEKSRAETALKNLQVEKTKAAEALKTAKLEKSRAEKEKTRACAESKRAQEYKIQIDALKSEAVEVRAQLSSATSKYEEANTRLESEVKKALAEKNRADLEKAEAEKLKKLVQSYEKNLAEGKHCVDALYCQLNVERKKNEQLLKKINELLSSKKTEDFAAHIDTNEGIGVFSNQLEVEKHNGRMDEKQAASMGDEAERKRKLEQVNEKKLTENTSRADHLFVLLENEKTKNHELQSRIAELTPPEKLLDANDVPNDKSSEAEELKKRLEVEKEKTVKEKGRANLMEAEADFQKKLAQVNEMKFSEAMGRVNSLSCQLEEVTNRNNELQNKIYMLVATNDSVIGNKAQNDKSTSVEELPMPVKTEKKKANRNTKSGDCKMAKLVDETTRDRTKALEEKKNGDGSTLPLKQCRKTVEKSRSRSKSHSQSKLITHAQAEEVKCTSHHNCTSYDELELKLLRQQMKIAKTKLKYGKKEVKFERIRSSILKKELDILKRQFFHISNRLDFLDRSMTCIAEGVDDSPVKVQGTCSRRKEQKFLGLKPLQIERECKTSLYVTNKLSNHVGQPPKHGMFPPLPGIKLAESTSGNSKLNPPAGNFDEDLFDSSAIDSSRVSLSNRGYVVAQENFCSSRTSSNRSDGIDIHPADSRIFGEVTELMQSVKPVTVANNGVRSRTNAVSSGERVRDKKRKRIHSLIDSVQHAFTETKKLHVHLEETVSKLHTELQSSVHISKDVAHDSCDGFDEFKQRNALRKQKASSQRSPNGKHIAHPEDSKLNGETVNPGTDILAGVPANDLPNGAPVCKARNVVQSTENGHTPSECHDHITDEDYMKLLDLDDHEDEKCYRVAKDHLLSPSLPDIDFRNIDVFPLIEVVNLASKDASVVGFSTAKCGLGISDLAKEEDKTGDCFEANECTKLDFPCTEADLSNLVPCGTTSPCEILLEVNLAKFIVVRSDIVDCDNLSRIFYAIRKGASQCCSSPSAGVLLKRILNYIQEDILPTDQVCVFFSMLLNGCRVATLGEPTSILNSFMSDFTAVINDVETLCCLERTLSAREVLNLIEEFIKNGKLWACLTRDENTTWAGDSSASIQLGSVKLTLEAASTEQLLVASSILASLSLALNDIDVVTRLSYNLFQLHKYNNSVVLAIVHVFAQLVGRNFLTSTSSRLLSSVVKSLVLFLESSHSPCSECPFSEEAVSLDAVLVLLFERLQSLMGKAKTRIGSNGSLEELPDPGISDIRPDLLFEEIFSQFNDVLSLVELISDYVGWEILSIQVVPQLLLMLESSTLDIFSMAIVVFLGRLGRKGVTTNGPEDTGVDRLRCQLTAMLGCDKSRKVILPLQIAIVCSLSGFLNIDLNSLLHQSADLNLSVAEASSACLISSWFTSLSKEQQSFFAHIRRLVFSS